MLIPIGHDQEFRRWPYLTGAIMLACLAVQLHSSIAGPSMMELFEATRSVETPARLALEDHRGELNSQARREGLHPREYSRLEAEFVERFVAGEVPDADPQLIEQMRVAREHLEALLQQDVALRMAYVPKDGVSIYMVLAAFAHGGWLHLIFNMIFFYLVACNLEDRWGRAVFGIFFVAGAAVSSWAYSLWHPGSEIGLIGASGAVSAAMGAFLVCFHRSQIQYLYYSFHTGVRRFSLPAYVALPFWFAGQALSSWLEVYVSLGVAYSAHVGGFVFGVLVAVGLKASGVEKKYLLPMTAKGVEWSEDDEFVAALDLVNDDKTAEAIVALSAFVVKNPRHTAAREELLRLGIEAGDMAVIDRHVSDWFASKDKTAADVVRFYRRLEDKAPTAKLNDRALARVVRAARSDDARMAVRVGRRLLTEHRQSSLVPGIMWEIAELQTAEGRDDLASRTLQTLVSRYPLDPFADRAKQKLELLT